MEILPDSVSDDIKLAALLHDVVEDTEVTLNELKQMGYSKTTLDIVDLLTHDEKNIPYFKYVKNVIEKGLFSHEDKQGVILVKYADMCHNTSPERNRADIPKETAQRFTAKYATPKKMLRTAVQVMGYEDFDPNRTVPSIGR